MLALISSIFILVASITGTILAIEPISNQLQPFKVAGSETLDLATTLETLSSQYDEVLSVEVDANDFVMASVFTNEGTNETFYVNPKTGEKLGDLLEKAPIYQFATSLHRSLFLKSTGRFMVGLISFFLFLMAITGVLLIAKRQGGFLRWFSKVVKEDFNSYYHVVLGRYLLIPIVIIALSGVYLSLEKFDLLPETKMSHNFPEDEVSHFEKPSFSELEGFKNLKLGALKSIEFPFSEAPEDYFFIKLKDRELYVQQYSGEIVSEQAYPFTKLASQWSLLLHTGQGSILWTIVLGLASIALMFFIYSGFAMSLKRTKKSTIPKNKFRKEDAHYIILVGSETGSTYTFASIFYRALLTIGKKAFLGSLNEYSTFLNAKELIVFTATYGEGEAPSNAKKFARLVQSIPQSQEIKYSVVGFGSLLYPAYCQFALEVDVLLRKESWFTENLELCKINNQSFEAFKNWARQWSRNNGLSLDLQPISSKADQKQSLAFKVVKKTALNSDASFLLQLKPQKRTKFESGDLLSFKLNAHEAARLYSVGKLNGDLLLSIKKHDKGLCSSYLHELNTGDTVNASIQRNPDFHFPKKAKNVVMIANGTGIAPFLGMINQHHQKANLHLFWGGRTKASFKMYQEVIYKAFDQKKVSSIHMAFSQEAEQKIYVQNLIFEKANFMAKHLKNEGVIMICGSIVMQNEVLEALQQISMSKLSLPLSNFDQRDQIKMDCY